MSESVQNPSDTRTVEPNGTEWKCPQCQDWYDPRGYRLHNMHCQTSSTSETDHDINDDTGHSDSQKRAEDTETEPDVPTLDVEPDTDIRTCPECSSTDTIPANKAAEALRHNNAPDKYVTGVQAEEQWCNNCHIAYSEEDL